MEKKLEEMTRAELSAYQNEKETDLRKMMDARQIFASKDIELKNIVKAYRKQILDVEIQISANKEQYDKADTSVKVINSLLREIKNRYFNVQI